MEPTGRPTPRPIWAFWLRPEPELEAEPAAPVVLAFVGFVEVGFGFVEEVAAASFVDGVFGGEVSVGLAGAPVAIAMLDDPAETVVVAVA